MALNLTELYLEGLLDYPATEMAMTHAFASTKNVIIQMWLNSVQVIPMQLSWAKPRGSTIVKYERGDKINLVLKHSLWNKFSEFKM